MYPRPVPPAFAVPVMPIVSGYWLPRGRLGCTGQPTADLAVLPLLYVHVGTHSLALPLWPDLAVLPLAVTHISAGAQFALLPCSSIPTVVVSICPPAVPPELLVTHLKVFISAVLS